MIWALTQQQLVRIKQNFENGKYKMIETENFLSVEYHGGSQTPFSKIIKRGLGPKVFPGQ